MLCAQWWVYSIPNEWQSAITHKEMAIKGEPETASMCSFLILLEKLIVNGAKGLWAAWSHFVMAVDF